MGSSSSALDEGAVGCRRRSSQQSRAVREFGSPSDAGARTAPSASGSPVPPFRSAVGATPPPILSSTPVWSPIPYPEEIRREEAFFRRTDHRLPAGSRCGHSDQGPVPAAWLQRGLVLCVAQQVRRHERARCQAAQGPRVRERAAEEVAGRVTVRERPDQGCAAKKVVSAPARRTLVREWIGRGDSERRALAAIGMSASALRYCSREDRNGELRERICALAHRHRRYGVW
ncbi:IS1404 transposase [Xanthomonas oryzae pv. oryzae KACC 10331]|uniref:IS1404 transposase n=1 Tax=Xanthomonas oryzae pv. oryzae (strain KACC10331 / KXO85) TaxID=291331 RepID=Q5GXX8_XANOR|nr:IS1404 transposase [Xanthomonas oryzae pv. oryzae KACC 10331]